MIFGKKGVFPFKIWISSVLSTWNFNGVHHSSWAFFVFLSKHTGNINQSLFVHFTWANHPMVLSLNLKPLDHLGGKNHLVATETSIWDVNVWMLNGFGDFRFCSLDIPAIDAYAQPRWESSKNAIVLVVLASWVGGGSVGVEKCYLPKPVRMSCSPMPVIRIIRDSCFLYL